jgi:hypothetical protein
MSSTAVTWIIIGVIVLLVLWIISIQLVVPPRHVS